MNYEFRLNMDDSYKQYTDIDEWEMAVVWVGYYGAEYNFCLQNGDDYSAIYFMEYNDETDYWETEYDCFEHYEIDFNNPNWSEDLEKEMKEYLFSILNKK